jgi:stage V sporulation protein B
MVGILQGLGRPYIAVVSLGTGVLVNAVLTYELTGIRALNVQGAAIATVAGLVVVGIMNFGLVKATVGTKFDVSLSVVRPLISGIVMTVFVLAVYYSLQPVIGNSLATALSILIGGSVYVIMLFKTKSIAASELKLLPKGDKLTILLQKMKLI